MHRLPLSIARTQAYLPTAAFDSMRVNDTEAELTRGMRSFAARELVLRVLDFQPSGTLTTAPLTSTGPGPRPISMLHAQHLDPSIVWTYAPYGQPNACNYGVYYPSFQGGDAYGNSIQYSFGAPQVNPSFGWTAISNSYHCLSSYMYPPVERMSYPPPRMAYVPVCSAMHSITPCSKRDIRPSYGFNLERPVTRFVPLHQNPLRYPPETERSPLLEHFRAKKSGIWQLRDIRGHVTEFCADQHGSRFIQHKIETANTEEKDAIFLELDPGSLLYLMTDAFGNHVVQKLFEFGSPEQRNRLAGVMEGHILSLSLQMYGRHVVEKAIEYITVERQVTFIKELYPGVVRCVKDTNGNHVIQKLIERLSPNLLGFVSAFQGSVYNLATHPFGCHVLQRCFEYLHESQTRPLIDELHAYTTQLMQDQFGNYVIQFVLEHGAPVDRNRILHKLRSQMADMARHKFASNVCEKALAMADSESCRLLIEEIMTPRPGLRHPIEAMMKDSFANYVLLRALQVAEGEQRHVLEEKVRLQLNKMRRRPIAYVVVFYGPGLSESLMLTTNAHLVVFFPTIKLYLSVGCKHVKVLIRQLF
ncbi:mRNA binding protein puf3 [Ceratobasidium sp. 370]|nr:mRNA binding protein puf3 [Ceratobasidium sp. 370]